MDCSCLCPGCDARRIAVQGAIATGKIDLAFVADAYGIGFGASDGRGNDIGMTLDVGEVRRFAANLNRVADEYERLVTPAGVN